MLYELSFCLFIVFHFIRLRQFVHFEHATLINSPLILSCDAYITATLKGNVSIGSRQAYSTVSAICKNSTDGYILIFLAVVILTT